MASNEGATLRERILQRALELFNESGIEYVGVRELARDLGIQAGNISYHFPTKDDLVLAIGLQLRELNDATIRLPDEPSLIGFMEMLERAFRNHHRFRCLFLSLPKLLIQNDEMAAAYVGTREVERRQVMERFLNELGESGLLRPELTDHERRRITSLCTLVARAWIGDAWVSFPDATPEWQMAYYLHLVVDHLHGVATPRGRRQLDRYRETLAGGWADSPGPGTPGARSRRGEPLRRFHS